MGVEIFVAVGALVGVAGTFVAVGGTLVGDAVCVGLRVAEGFSVAVGLVTRAWLVAGEAAATLTLTKSKINRMTIARTENLWGLFIPFLLMCPVGAFV